MITLKEAFEDLHDRTQKQIAETMWGIERISPMSPKEVEDFHGKGVRKDAMIKNLKRELAEREKNLEVLDGILSKYAKQ